MNFKLLKIALLVVLLVGLYFLFQGGAIFVTNKQPVPPATKTEAPATPSPAKQESAATESPNSGTIELARDPSSQSTPLTNSEFSYSLKKDNNERQITPGVTVIPGQGISLKTASKDETVQLQRDKTYNGDYQVLWKKKY